MHWTQIVGTALLAAPFVGLFAVGYRSIGLVGTLITFAVTIGIVATVGAGVFLATGGAA